MTPEVLFQHLTFTHRRSDTPALRDITGSVRPGERVVIMGGSGSGKSSLCYAISGVIPHLLKGTRTGRVFVRGVDPATRPVADMARLVSLVLEDFDAQIMTSSVERELVFGLENSGVSRAEMIRIVERYLAVLRFESRRSDSPSSLSAGNRHMLAIASLLVLESSVLVMDEPTTELDPGAQERLQLVSKVREGEVTLLMADHRTETAQWVDSVWLLERGSIAAAGTPAEVLTDLPTLRGCGVRPPELVSLAAHSGLTTRLWSVDDIVDALGARRPAPPAPAQSEIASRPRPIIESVALRHVYRSGLEALRGVDVTIAEGELAALIGANGSGKTTFARLLIRLIEATSGDVLLGGRSVASYSRRELTEMAGFVFESPDEGIVGPRVFDDVAFSLRRLGWEEARIAARVTEVLAEVGLIGYEDCDAVLLGRGERQRVAIASALATSPRVLILDEPTKGLDYDQQLRLFAMLRRLHQQGHTILLITHLLWAVAEYATRVVVFNSGSVVAQDETREVFRREELLESAGLRLPDIARVSNRLGLQALEAVGMARELAPQRQVWP